MGNKGESAADRIEKLAAEHLVRAPLSKVCVESHYGNKDAVRAVGPDETVHLGQPKALLPVGNGLPLRIAVRCCWPTTIAGIDSRTISGPISTFCRATSLYRIHSILE